RVCPRQNERIEVHSCEIVSSQAGPVTAGRRRWGRRRRRAHVEVDSPAINDPRVVHQPPSGGTARTAPDALVPTDACEVYSGAEFDEVDDLGGAIPDRIDDRPEIEEVSVGLPGLTNPDGLPEPPSPGNLPVERRPVDGPIERQDVHIVCTG